MEAVELPKERTAEQPHEQEPEQPKALPPPPEAAAQQPPPPPPPKRPKGRQAGYRPPKVKVETVYQEERVLNELEHIKGQITELKRAKSSVEAQEAQDEAPTRGSSLPPIFESRVNRLKEKKAGYSTLWGNIHA